ncbi:MAG: hypothetical protein A2157_10600 [Deltaproteobacteria bacterium RBG_16_47_11]|nr:MAG: hypothetical protein A2157_10600 [Deltaproteobacteria bacterium RBG_16_47_11]
MKKRDAMSRSKSWTRRQFLKTAGATAVAVGGTTGFPTILKYALGETPIKLGAVCSMSGTMSILGQDMIDASMLAEEQINAKGGIIGRKLQILARDDAGNVGLSTTRTKELIEKDKVNFLAGANLGSTVIAQLEQVLPHKNVMYIANAMSDPITAVPAFSRRMFHSDITPYMMGQTIARYTAEKLGKRWYFLMADYAWGWQNYEAYAKVLAEYKGENLGISPHPLGTKDFSPYIGKIMAANPEVLIQIAPGFDQVNAFKQLREFGAFDKMKIVTGLYMPGTIWAVGWEVIADSTGGATFYWEAPETKEVSDAFWKKFNRPPTDDALSQYEAVREICSAVERAKSMDVEKLIKAMEGHKFKWAKTEEWWRPCDHQAIQDVYILEPKKPSGQFSKYDCFKIIERKGGEILARTCEDQGHKKDAKGNWIRYQ